MRSINELIVLMKDKAYDIKKRMTADVFLDVAEALEKLDRLQKEGRDHTTCMNEWSCGWSADPKDCPTYEADKNMVIHPKHYNADGRQECWNEMLDKFGADAVIAFDCLSAYKYSYRKGLKDGNPAVQDAKKIDNYLLHANKLLLRKDVKDHDACFALVQKVVSEVGRE